MATKLFDQAPVAAGVPFDNTDGNNFTSTNVQSAIEEIGASASPGFSFGRSGGLLANTWLYVDGSVPSNSVGRYIPINNPVVSRLFVGCDSAATFTITLYQHTGNLANLSTLATLTVTAATGADSGIISVAATKGYQLAIQVTSGSANNVVAGVILKGTK